MRDDVTDMTTADIPTVPNRVPTSSELRRMTAGDIAVLRRNTDNADTLFLLTLVEIENSRMGR